MLKRILAIGVVYVIAVIGWVALGSTIVYRTENQDSMLKQEVGQLWGTPLRQQAPSGTLAVEREIQTEKVDPLTKKKSVEKTIETDNYDASIVQSDIRVHLELDQRQKGLLWYSTYRVRFSADYVLENTQDKSGKLALSFSFPAADGLYDDFKFEVDGAAIPFTREEHSNITATIPCEARALHRLSVNYYSQGLDRFAYNFGDGINEVRNFHLTATTDFDRYDHPGDTISPTRKERKGKGWEMVWEYRNLLAGNGIGIEMPQKINPGPMAARISFFAPVSLGFFFFLIFVIAQLKGVEIHPMNYFFMAAAFFAFHLLLAYLADHISIHAAFGICSAVSIFLVVSYMRIVTGRRFAYFETALAQFVYLIGFSYAFFLEGFTGLAVTIGAIITLFIVMQMTARIDWSQRFSLAAATDGEQKALTT